MKHCPFLSQMHSFVVAQTLFSQNFRGPGVVAFESQLVLYLMIV